MSYIVPRPDGRPIGTPFAPEFFQIAYVTNDIEQACAILGRRYGIAEFTALDVQLPQGGSGKMRLAWVGKMMIEIVDAQGEGAQMYRSLLPAEGFAIRHHHLGFLIENDAQWDALRATCIAEGMTIEITGSFADALRFFYCKAPDLNHYLEYIQLYEGGRGFFASIAKS